MRTLAQIEQKAFELEAGRDIWVTSAEFDQVFNAYKHAGRTVHAKVRASSVTLMIHGHRVRVYDETNHAQWLLKQMSEKQTP